MTGKNKRYDWILGVVLAVFLVENGIIVLNIRNTDKNHEALAPQLQELVLYKEKCEFNIQTLLGYLDTDGRTIGAEEITCIRPANKKEMCDTFPKSLASLLDRDKIIFRFFRFSCTSCIKEQLVQLEKLAAKIGRENILLLTDDLHDQLDKFMQQNQIGLPVYQWKHVETKLLPCDKDLIPYLLYVDMHGNVKTSLLVSLDTKKYDKYFYRAVGRRMEKLPAVLAAD